MAVILIVDDESDMRSLVAMIVEGDGHVAHTAANGVEAMAILTDTPVDVVITDILMPEMEGVETVRAIKSLPKPPRVLVMSGGGRLKAMDFLDIATAFGADASLAKPFTSAQLRSSVEALLGAAARDSET